MYQVFRVHRGRALHVIHESRTGRNRTNDVYVLCGVTPVSGERERGTATCQECLELDNPCDLNHSEINYFSRVVGNDPAFQSYRGDSNARTKLIKRDLIDRDNRLTRRGKILADDFLKSPAPAASVSGVVHARGVLMNAPRCNHGGVLAGFDGMSVESYARLRNLDLHITCIQCLRV